MVRLGRLLDGVAWLAEFRPCQAVQGYVWFGPVVSGGVRSG